MKATIERGPLLKALGHMKGAVEKRNTIPILANVHLDVQEDRLTISATNMDLLVVEQVVISNGCDGSTTVPAALLTEIVRRLPVGTVIEITKEKGETPLQLRAGSYETDLFALSADDFPKMTVGDFSHQFTMPASVLRGLIDRSRFAISAEETRYYLNGIYLHTATGETGDMLRAVTTDGHRLARIETELPPGAAGMPGVIVPRKTVAELRKLITKSAGEVDLFLSDTRVRFVVDGTLMTSKLIDGTFPEYQRVIPTNNSIVMRVGKKNFIEAVGRVAVINSYRSSPVKLSMSTDTCTLSALSADRGRTSEKMNGGSVEYTAAPFETGFQARYLKDIADQITDDMEFLFNGTDQGPTLIRDVASTSALYVVMPMRV